MTQISEDINLNFDLISNAFKIGRDLYQAVKEYKKKKRDFMLFKALIQLFHEESEQFAYFFISGFIISSRKANNLVNHIREAKSIDNIPEKMKEKVINEIIEDFSITLNYISNTKLPILDLEDKLIKLTDEMHNLVYRNHDNFYHMCMVIHEKYQNRLTKEIFPNWEEDDNSNLEDVNEYIIHLYKESKTYSEIIKGVKSKFEREISRGYIYRRVTDNDKYKIKGK